MTTETSPSVADSIPAPAAELSPAHNPLREIVDKAIADIEALGYDIKHAFLHFVHPEHGHANFTKSPTSVIGGDAGSPAPASAEQVANEPKLEGSDAAPVTQS